MTALILNYTRCPHSPWNGTTKPSPDSTSSSSRSGVDAECTGGTGGTSRRSAAPGHASLVAETRAADVFSTCPELTETPSSMRRFACQVSAPQRIRPSPHCYRAYESPHAPVGIVGRQAPLRNELGLFVGFISVFLRIGLPLPGQGVSVHFRRMHRWGAWG